MRQSERKRSERAGKGVKTCVGALLDAVLNSSLVVSMIGRGDDEELPEAVLDGDQPEMTRFKAAMSFAVKEKKKDR